MPDRERAGVMDLNQQKEQFSRAYVHAVAACAGFAWSVASVDDDSVDMTLHQTGGGRIVRSPKVDLQLKCKAMVSPTESTFSHFIKLKNYDDLRDEAVATPRILIVVLVPDDPADWLFHTEVELAVRRCGYWHSLRGLPPSVNPTGQTVQISRERTFTVEALRGIMERIGSGELP
jgi:Domain of unknown function (DUF4365)